MIRANRSGVEIISNSSGSHHELRKLDTRINLITQATQSVWIIVLEEQIRADAYSLVVYISM